MKSILTFLPSLALATTPNYISFSQSNASHLLNSTSTPDLETSSNFPLWYTLPDAPTWTWNINLTEIPASSSNRSLQDPTQLVTTYSLSWPSSNATDLRAEIESASDGVGLNQSERFCVTVVQNLFPENITNSLNPGGTGGTTCGEAFYDCYLAVLDAWSSSTRDPQTGCLGSNVDPTTFPQCRGSWNRYNVTTYNLWGADVQNGETFFYRESGVYEKGNTTYLNAERLRMQILVLEYGRIREVVCGKVTRANATEEMGGVDVPTGGAGSLGVNVLGMGIVGVVAGLALGG